MKLFLICFLFLGPFLLFKINTVSFIKKTTNRNQLPKEDKKPIINYALDGIKNQQIDDEEPDSTLIIQTNDYLKIGLEFLTNAQSYSEALRESETRVKSAIYMFKYFGLNDADINIVIQNITPSNNFSKEQITKVYTINQIVEVTINSKILVGLIIDHSTKYYGATVKWVYWLFAEAKEKNKNHLLNNAVDDVIYKDSNSVWYLGYKLESIKSVKLNDFNSNLENHNLCNQLLVDIQFNLIIGE